MVIMSYICTLTPSGNNMTVKEILSEITDYITLSPIANKHYGKSRQWLYHKVNEDIINKVQYKLSDEEIDILISALDGIKDNIYNVMRNLEHFKLEREYLRIPEEDRKLLEKYEEQMREFSIANQREEQQELIREIYASETSIYLIEYADSCVDYHSWYLLNLKNEPIEYDGSYVETIVNSFICDIEEKVQAESKKKKRKKKKDDFEEDDDDNNDYDKYNEILNLQNDARTISYKIYYRLNNLIPSESLQEKIDKLPRSITLLGNIEVSEIEKLVLEKIREDIKGR